MCKPRTMRVHTPIGDLLVEVGETDFSYYAAVCLERKDGEVIDLTEGDIVKNDNSAEVVVWSDTTTNEWTHKFKLSNEDLMIEQE